MFETLYYTQYQGRVCTTSKVSCKHMYMHIFIIIILSNKFVIHVYLTHDEDHKVIYYAIYYASLTHACYIVLFCHGSREEDQAQETDQSSDGFTSNDVVDINDQHYFDILRPMPFFGLGQRIFFSNISVKTTFSQKPLDQLKATFMCSFLKTQTNQKTTMGRSP